MSDRSHHHPSRHPNGVRYNDRDPQEHDRYRNHPDYRESDYRDYAHRPGPSEPVRYPGAEFLVDRRRPATQSLGPASQAATGVEEVWMKEKSGRISFNDSDLADVAYPRSKGFNVPLAGAGGVLAMLALIGFLALSSLPDLSPQEIIAMDGYGGEQATKTPFNLASLRDCNDVNDCAETMDAPVATTTTTIETTTGNLQPTEIAPVTYTDEAPIAVTIAVEETPSATLSEFTDLQEIPAATSVATVSNTTYEAPAFEQLTVLRQWSNVRSSPAANGNILTSLAKGTDVTLLSQTGEWFEISVFDRTEIIGYMHRSTVIGQEQ